MGIIIVRTRVLATRARPYELCKLEAYSRTIYIKKKGKDETFDMHACMHGTLFPPSKPNSKPAHLNRFLFKRSDI